MFRPSLGDLKQPSPTIKLSESIIDVKLGHLVKTRWIFFKSQVKYMFSRYLLLTLLIL